MNAAVRRGLLAGVGAAALAATFLGGRLTRSDPDKPAAEAAAAPAPAGQVSLGEEAQRNVGLQVVAAAPRRLQRRLEAPAVVAADESRSATLHPVGRGRVLSVAAHPGDAVTQGQVLLTYDDIALSEVHMQEAAARAALSEAQASQAVARQAYARGRALLGSVVPAGEVERRRAVLAQADGAVATQQAGLSDVSRRLAQFVPAGPQAPRGASAVAAPSDGYVLTIAAAPGDMVEPTEVVATVADLSQVWVVAAVYQNDIGVVQAGGPATITVPGLSGRVFEATVASVGRALDPQTGAVQVRCVVANPDRALRIGLFASVELPTTQSGDALSVPAAAVQQVDGHPAVFVRTGDSTFVQHGVELGVQADGFTEIKDGIAAGDLVVTDGSFALKSTLLQSQLGAGN